MNLIDLLPEKYVAQGRWWGKPLSLVNGCTKVSRGCDHCWAEAMGARFRFADHHIGVINGLREWSGYAKTNSAPLVAMKRRRKPTVYAVWNDLFHPDVHESYQVHVISNFRDNPRHIFITCTKRPDRMAEFTYGDGNGFPPNVIAMVSVEDQATLEERAPWLLRTHAAIRAVNYEPALGPVDFRSIYKSDDGASWDVLRGICTNYHFDIPGKIDWVLCGGESGPGARPMHPEWVRSVRDQCQAAGVPFWFKQWGEWGEITTGGVRLGDICLSDDGDYDTVERGYVCAANESDGNWMRRVGSKAAGRVLDGRFWNETPVLPEVR